MFEEVKEMIDSTVYTNGNGEVTAQNINLAMHGIVDAVEAEVKDVKDKVAEIEQPSEGGNEVANVYIPTYADLTDDELAKNRDAFEKMKNGAPVQFAAYQENQYGYYNHNYVYAYLSEDDAIILFVEYDDKSFTGTTITSVIHKEDWYIMYSDGSVVLELSMSEEPSSPASSGPLTFYVGYVTTLSAEERITAEQKEHNAKMFEIYKSSPYALGVFLDQSEMFTASMGMSGRAIKTSAHYQAQYFPVETGAEAILLKEKLTNNDEIGVVILPDGSVYMANELE